MQKRIRDLQIGDVLCRHNTPSCAVVLKLAPSVLSVRHLWVSLEDGANWLAGLDEVVDVQVKTPPVQRELPIA